MTAESPEQTDWINSIEVELDRYAFKRMKLAIQRAEELKAGTMRPDFTTAEVMVRIANEWLQVETPHFYPRYAYKIRGGADNWEVYQNIKDEPKPPEQNDPLEPV